MSKLLVFLANNTSNNYGADALHNVSRLLSVEIRPYQRLASAVLKPDALLNARPTQLPTPPPDASAADEQAILDHAQQQKDELHRFRDNILREAELFNFSILRMKHSHASNEKERERYDTEIDRIQKASQSIRENTLQLRADLSEAKEKLAQRKKFDQLTEKIVTSKVLKPRDEQAVSHAKLDEEINELNEEVEGFKRNWKERRVQFARVVDEGRHMLSKIKEDKEEAERKDMMKNGDDVEDGEASTVKGEVSYAGTPRPDAGGSTPLHTQESETTGQLKVPRDRLAPVSRSPSVAPSTKQENSANREDKKDHEMVDSTEPLSDQDLSSIESGEEAEDSMDTT